MRRHQLLCVAALGSLIAFRSSLASDDAPPVRGRDPFVFRTILDEKTRMCIAALRPDLYVAYDPATCSLERVFGGGLEFHGKVFDFSQQCTRAKGPFFYSQPADVLKIEDCSVIPPGYEATGVTTGTSLAFHADGAMLVSPQLDLTRFTNVNLVFEERSRRAPFRIEVSDDGGATWGAQWFQSTLHRDSDTDWQENMKRISANSSSVRLRFVAAKATDAKELRAVRMKAAYRAWQATAGDHATPVETDWLGYERAGANGQGRLTLRYALVLDDGKRVEVDESPEALAEQAGRVGLERRFTVRGLVDGRRLELSLVGQASDPTYRVTGKASLRADALVIEGDGEVAIEQWWGRP